MKASKWKAAVVKASVSSLNADEPHDGLATLPISGKATASLEEEELSKVQAPKGIQSRLHTLG
jgi:hypothetical protein